MKVLCIGHASYDITFPIESFIIENTKNRVNEKIECGGGPASNAAYLLGIYGIETYFMGLIGDDYYANKILKEFEKVNVNTKYLLKDNNYKTTVSTIFANKSNGSRTILTYKDNQKSYPIIDIDLEPDVILIDGQEPEISKYMINKHKKAISIIDAGRNTPEIIELAQMVNYLVCSKEFAESITGITIEFNNQKTLNDTYIMMEQQFKNTIVITLEDKGCLYKVNDTIKLMPSIKVKAIDSTGAGDLFHGAFVYGIVKNFNLEKILKVSNIVGALSVTKIGGRNSVPTKEEVKKIYANFE